MISLIAIFPLGAQTWDAALPTTLDKLTANHWQPHLQAAFGTFTYEYSDLPSPFSRWLEENLATAMTKSANLKLFNRAAAAAMDPTFKAIYSDYFKSNGVDGLIYGRYFDEGDTIRARVELTGLADGILIGTLDLSIPKKVLPKGLTLAPTKTATATAEGIVSVLPPREVSAREKGGLSVSVSTERGPGAVYREGEDLVILVAVNKEAFVKLYHIDVNGAVQLIWPNRYAGGGKLKPNQIVRIPAQSDPFRFRMTAPFGTEFIKAIASTTPFYDTEADFSELGKDAPNIIARGVAIVPVEAPAGKQAPVSSTPLGEMAEAMASYLIMEAKR